MNKADLPIRIYCTLYCDISKSQAAMVIDTAVDSITAALKRKEIGWPHRFWHILCFQRKPQRAQPANGGHH